MNSLENSIVISEDSLGLIKEKAKSIGHLRAVREVLDLPEFPIEQLKDWALWNFKNLPTGLIDRFFVERIWIKAFEILMTQGGKEVVFEFPYIERYISQSNRDDDLPEKSTP